MVGHNFCRDYVRFDYLVEVCKMTTPFKALQPFEPRVIDIPYAAFALSCAPDCTDCSDSTDATDVTDVTDDEMI